MLPLLPPSYNLPSNKDVAPELEAPVVTVGLDAPDTTRPLPYPLVFDGVVKT